MRWLPFLLVLSLCAALLGCQVEVYRGLTEAQVNTMLSTLLKRGIRAEKTAAGKAGFTLSVDEEQLVQSLEILKENNLPRADYENLGKVFSGQGMISSASEEQARMAYAISQELSDTFSRIDGVLTARVHVVLGGTDQATDTRTLPSAAVSSAIPRIRLSSTWSPKSVSLRPRPCRISTMNVFPSCSFRFGNRFPYPWSQPRNSSDCRLRRRMGRHMP